METALLTLPSLQPTVSAVCDSLESHAHTALISAPGCGATTLAKEIMCHLGREEKTASYFDMESRVDLSEHIERLKALSKSASVGGGPLIVVIDHAHVLSKTSIKKWCQKVKRYCDESELNCLWVGPLDAKVLRHEVGLAICDVPKAHISFPFASREDILTVYKSIASLRGCNWGDAISFLMLDLCGNDFSLLYSATEYFHGDWTGRMYDASSLHCGIYDNSVWERVRNWIITSEVINQYRKRMRNLTDGCQEYINLLRLGGKPICERAAWFDEPDDRLRRLCLDGFLTHNLLPAYYRPRNLIIRFLIQEPFNELYGDDMETMFRCTASERITALVQEVELMLRLVLTPVLANLGDLETRLLLERKQTDKEFIPSDLNRNLLKWAADTGGSALRKSLGKVLYQARLSFKQENSTWSRIQKSMAEEGLSEEDLVIGKYARYVEYLSFKELGDLVLSLFDEVFPDYKNKKTKVGGLRQRWLENLAKVRRLRNRVAHLRNVGFQDMEDLVAALERMRNDLINNSAWRG